MTRRVGRVRAPWFLVLLTVATLLQAATAVARPMASYRALEIGLPPEALGFVAAAFAIAPLAFALSIGRLIDRYGESIFQAAAAVMMALSCLALALAASPLALFPAIAALGLSQLGFVVANQAIVASRTAPGDYDRRFGHLSFVASFGQLIGPAAGGLVAGEGSVAGTTAALLLGVALSVVALPLVLVAWRRDPGPAVPVPAVRPERPPILAILRMPGMGPAMLASMTVLSAMDVLVVYLPALGEERGLAAATVGALLAVRAAASMTSRLLLGRLVAAVGRERLMLVSLVVSAVAIVVLPFVPTEAMFAIMAVAGLTLGVCQPMTMSWVAARATAGSRATAMSLRLMGNRLGQVLIPIAAGSVAAVTGTAGVLAATGLAIAGSAVVVGSRRAPAIPPSTSAPGGTGRNGPA